MRTIRKSVGMDEEMAERVARAAAESGVSVSAWLAQAAESWVRRHEGLRGVSEWEAEAGALTPEERAAGEIMLERMLRERGRRA